MDNDSFGRIPQPRNLAIFWGVTVYGRSQAELAKEHGISRQRVSQIVRKVGEFVALATSDVYDGFPQGAQLQFACRVHMERLKKRHRQLNECFDLSMQPILTEKRIQTEKGMRYEWQKKGQHGDWRLSKALHDIEREMCETRLLLYQRKWFGYEEANRGRRAAAGRTAEGGAGTGERRFVTPLPCGPAEPEERREVRPVVGAQRREAVSPAGSAAADRAGYLSGGIDGAGPAHGGTAGADELGFGRK